ASEEARRRAARGAWTVHCRGDGHVYIAVERAYNTVSYHAGRSSVTAVAGTGTVPHRVRPKRRRPRRYKRATLELLDNAERRRGDLLDHEESIDGVGRPVRPACPRISRGARIRAEVHRSRVRRKDGRILGGEEIVDLRLGIQVEDSQQSAAVASRGRRCWPGRSGYERHYQSRNKHYRTCDRTRKHFATSSSKPGPSLRR